MDHRTRDLYQAALQLPEAERETLVDLLLPTLERDQQEITAAWAEEIKRRLQEMDSGLVEPVPWEEVKRAMRKLRSA